MHYPEGFDGSGDYYGPMGHYASHVIPSGHGHQIQGEPHEYSHGHRDEHDDDHHDTHHEDPYHYDRYASH